MEEEHATVYVVDQDESIRDSMQLMFSTFDIVVETFPTAGSFLEAVQQSEPCCLIIDINLPDGNGLDLIERMQQSNCLIPTIVLTSEGDVPMAVRAMRLGAVDFIEKPVVARNLVRRVGEVLGKPLV